MIEQIAQSLLKNSALRVPDGSLWDAYEFGILHEVNYAPFLRLQSRVIGIGAVDEGSPVTGMIQCNHTFFLG